MASPIDDLDSPPFILLNPLTIGIFIIVLYTLNNNISIKQFIIIIIFLNRGDNGG